MVWKILGIVLAVWIALAAVGVLVKALFPILLLGALGFGGYMLVRALGGADEKPQLTRR